MKSNKAPRFILLICLAALLAALAAGCAKKVEIQPDTPETPEEKVVVSFWHSYVVSSQPALKRLITRFEEEHPNIDLQAQYVQTGDALLQKLAAAITTGNTPDICWIHKSWVVPLSRQGSIYDLEELAQEYGGFGEAEKADFFETPLKVSYYDGKLYMMPIEGTNLTLVYNRDLFRKAGLNPDKPPKDWKEFVEYGKKLTIREGDKTTQWACTVPFFTGSLASHTVWHWKFFLWGEGGEFADPSGTKVNFNSEAGERALQFWVDLENKYKIGSMNSPEQGFESQRVAMAFMGSWDIPHLKELEFDWAVAPMPAGSVRKVSPFGGETLVIFKESHHPKEAWEFVRWFITPEVQEAWSIDSGYLPIRHSALQSPTYRAYLETDPALKGFADEAPDGYAEAVLLPDSSHIDQLVATAIEKALRGKATPKEALEEAAEKANAVIAEARAKQAGESSLAH